MELSGGTTQAQYTGGLATYGPLVSQRRSSTSRFYHPTDLGTIETLTDTSAATTDAYTLDAYGNQIASTGSTTNPHRYIGALGYYTESDLGLAYVRARWLRPSTGSWLSVDPIEGDERYGYAGGGPTWRRDPAGEQSQPSLIGRLGLDKPGDPNPPGLQPPDEPPDRPPRGKLTPPDAPPDPWGPLPWPDPWPVPLPGGGIGWCWWDYDDKGNLVIMCWPPEPPKEPEKPPKVIGEIALGPGTKYRAKLGLQLAEGPTIGAEISDGDIKGFITLPFPYGSCEWGYDNRRVSCKITATIPLHGPR
jgi:RHS repeat-associated protein